MLLYRVVQAAVRAAMNVFFREIHLVGTENIPPEGSNPVIFAGNHPNSLIDPALVVSTAGRIVHFAAKDKLFTFPMSLILGALGAVPIARAMDAKPGEQRDNSDALDEMCSVLAKGRSVGIFPEGLSHDDSQLQRVRSGASRIALRTAESYPDAGVVVIPVGLAYMHRKSFRSQVIVQYGEPIPITGERVEAWKADNRAAAQALNREIEEGIRALTVNAPDWETLRVLDGVRRLYQPKDIPAHHRVELARRFCEGYAEHAEHPKVRAVYQEMAIYLETLDRLGLQDRDLTREVRWDRVIGNLLRLALVLPLALPTVPIHAPLYAAISWAGVQFSPRNDVVGTSRVVFGALAIATMYASLPVLAGFLHGWLTGLGLALFLPISGLATVNVLERTGSLKRLATTATSAFTLRAQLDALHAQRAELEQHIVELVSELIPEDMEPLYPRGA